MPRMDISKTSRMTTEPTDLSEVYSAINARQITALMFHDEMADLFDFLGLKGFKRMHEYQFLSESIEHRKLKRYYLNHHNKLLEDTELVPVAVLPDDWVKYTRMDVTASIRKQAVQKAMEDYHTWESGTKALYEKCATMLMNWGHIADFSQICCLIEDVDHELKCLERLHIELKSVDYSMEYIMDMQDCYHKKYKKLTSEIGEES